MIIVYVFLVPRLLLLFLFPILGSLGSSGPRSSCGSGSSIRSIFKGSLGFQVFMIELLHVGELEGFCLGPHDFGLRILELGLGVHVDRRDERADGSDEVEGERCGGFFRDRQERVDWFLPPFEAEAEREGLADCLFHLRVPSAWSCRALGSLSQSKRKIQTT